jgi:hypothetical protein
LIVKTIFKSHFKIKKNFLKNKDKKIFVKNIIVFLLFTKIFVSGCVVSFFFKKNKVNCTNILKAPSRHKQFFHQVFYEFFQVNVFFNFIKMKTITKTGNSVVIFEKLNLVFQKIGTNILTRTKILISFFFVYGYNY